MVVHDDVEEVLGNFAGGYQGSFFSPTLADFICWNFQKEPDLEYQVSLFFVRTDQKLNTLTLLGP